MFLAIFARLVFGFGQTDLGAAALGAELASTARFRFYGRISGSFVGGARTARAQKSCAELVLDTTGSWHFVERLLFRVALDRLGLRRDHGVVVHRRRAFVDGFQSFARRVFRFAAARRVGYVRFVAHVFDVELQHFAPIIGTNGFRSAQPQLARRTAHHHQKTLNCKMRRRVKSAEFWNSDKPLSRFKIKALP